MVCHWKIYQTVLCCWVWGWMGGGAQGWGGGRSGRLFFIDNGRVYQSKAADALVQVKTTTFGTNVGLKMLLNISSRYFGGLFWSRRLRGLPSSDGYFSIASFLGRCLLISFFCFCLSSFAFTCCFSKHCLYFSGFWHFKPLSIVVSHSILPRNL